MTERKKAAEVVPLFGRTVEIEEVKVGHAIGPQTEAMARPAAALDLSDQPKVLMAIGLGSSGKTTLLRWAAERALKADRQVLFAAVDPDNRELKDYFAGVHEPPSYDPANVLRWLENFLAFAMENRASAAIDFGGGDTSLGRLVAEFRASSP